MKTLALVLSLLPFTAFSFQPDVVLDDADTTAVELVGPWVAETNLTNAFRGTSKVITGTTVNTAQYARFHTQLPVSGPWKVFVWHNGRTGFGDEVNIVTKVGGGETPTVTVGEHVYAGQWMLVGTYWFEHAEEAEVKIVHNDAGSLSADAIRFSFAAPEVILDSTGDTTGVKMYNASGVISSATWPSTAIPDGNEINTRRTTVVGAKIEFIPTLPTPGDYEVSVWLPRRGGGWISSGTGATTITVEVHHRTGIATHTVDLPPDNGQNEGAWIKVGTTPFRFDATPSGQTGGPGKVVIKGPAASGTCVPADAVRWNKVGTLAIYQDDDDPAGPPGVVLGTKLSNQTPNWLIQYDVGQVARRFLYFDYQPFGAGFMRAQNNDQRATYKPPLPEQGLYDVYLWYSYYNTNSPTTLLTVNGAYNSTGTKVNVSRTIDQRYEAGRWAHAGRYILDANPAGPTVNSWLTIEPNNNTATQFTKADGVLFLRDGEEADADGDGLPDWKEIVLHTNSSGLDLNNDGRADGWDTDGDGMSDGYEYSLGLNPLSAPQPTTDSAIVGVTVLTPLAKAAQ